MVNVIAIPESGSAEHVQENAVALSLTLTPDELYALDAAHPPSNRTVARSTTCRADRVPSGLVQAAADLVDSRLGAGFVQITARCAADTDRCDRLAADLDA
jgi:hypothetical protein